VAVALVVVAAFLSLPSLAESLVTAALLIRRCDAPLARLQRLQRRLHHDAQHSQPAHVATPLPPPPLRTLAELHVSLSDCWVSHTAPHGGLVQLVLRNVNMDLPPGACVGECQPSCVCRVGEPTHPRPVGWQRSAALSIGAAGHPTPALVCAASCAHHAHRFSGGGWRTSRRSGVLGVRGAGKTALLRVLGGLEAMDRGVVRMGGVEASAATLSRAAAVMGADVLLFEASVRFNVALGFRVSDEVLAVAMDASGLLLHSWAAHHSDERGGATSLLDVEVTRGP
jgi:hypothetical protein